MITIDFTLDTPFLGEAVGDAPRTTLSWERTDVIGEGRVCALLWAEGGDFEALEAGMHSDPTVEPPTRTVRVGERRLYQVEVTGEALDGTYPLLAEEGCLVQRAKGSCDGWELRVAFPDQPAVDRFFAHCRSTGLGFDVRRIYEERDEADSERFGLTPAQLETLRAAVELGYLDVPRENTLDDLGRRLGVSDTAASQRFRRGVKRLVENTLDPTTESNSPPVEQFR